METDESQIADEFSTHKVPGEVWLEIFEYLPCDDLLASTLVCSHWNSLISKSGNFISRTNLIFYNFDWSALFAVGPFKLTRPYDHVEINDSQNSLHSQLILSQLSKSADHLKFVGFWTCKLSASDFLNFIKICKKLEDLMIDRCMFEGNYEDLLTVELSSLDSFYFKDADDWILDHLNCKSVRSDLEFAPSSVSEDSKYTILKRIDGIVRFLNRLEGCISQLNIEEINLDQSKVILDPKFTWQYLELSCKRVENMMGNMFNSEMTNKQKLVEACDEHSKLLLRFDRGHPQIYNILTKSKKVDLLYIGPDELSNPPNSYELLPDLPHIKTLIFRSLKKDFFNSDSAFVEPFLRKLVNLEELRMDAHLAKHLNIDAALPYQPGIKLLDLTFDSSFFDGRWPDFDKLKSLILPKIQKLKIDCYAYFLGFSDAINLLATTIGKNNPTLKEMVIDVHACSSMKHAETILLEVFAVMTTIQTLKINASLEEDENRIRLSLGGTCDEIQEKYFGNPQTLRQSLAIIKHREINNL